MDDILSLVMSQMKGGTLSTISKQIGAEEATTQAAVSAGIPMLITALANNASRPGQAEQIFNAVAKDHDGGLLDNLGGFLGNPAAANGAAILGHILGGKRPTVEAGLSKGTGLNMSQIAQLLQILAPIVMAAIGKAQRSQGLDPGALAGMLGQQKTAATKQGGGLLGSLAGILDADGDGSAVDDIGRIAGSLFKK